MYAPVHDEAVQGHISDIISPAKYACSSHSNPAAPRIEGLMTAVYDRYNGLNIAAERQRNGGAVTTRLCQENNKGM